VLPHLKKEVNMVLEQYIAQDFNAHLVVGIPSFGKTFLQKYSNDVNSLSFRI
jgi:hypothetical protein